jgi:hypothetical protein
MHFIRFLKGFFNILKSGIFEIKRLFTFMINTSFKLFTFLSWYNLKMKIVVQYVFLRWLSMSYTEELFVSKK